MESDLAYIAVSEFVNKPYVVMISPKTENISPIGIRISSPIIFPPTRILY